MSRSAVIVYHAIGEPPRRSLAPLFVSVAAFAKQLEYLATRRRVVPLDEIVTGEAAGRPPAVAITFDDAYRSLLTDALPLLRRYGFPATVFAASGWIGRRSTWDADATNLDVMIAEELAGLEDSDVEIQSHGHAHLDLAAAPLDVARQDLVDSRATLSRILGEPPQYLAYPWGSSSPTVRDAARAEGFTAGFTIDMPGEGDYARERIGITAFDGLLVFALKTSGRYLSLRHSSAFARMYAPLRGVVNRRRA